MKLKAMMECAVLAGMLVCVSPLPAPAQWQTPNHSVPIGKGAGTGFGSAGPCPSGGVPVYSSATVDPACSTVDGSKVGISTSGNTALGLFSLGHQLTPLTQGRVLFFLDDVSNSVNGHWLSAAIGTGTPNQYLQQPGSLAAWSAEVNVGDNNLVDNAFISHLFQTTASAGVGGGMPVIYAHATMGGTWTPGSVGNTGPQAIVAIAESSRGGFIFGMNPYVRATSVAASQLVGIEVDIDNRIATTGDKIGIQVIDLAASTQAATGNNVAYLVMAQAGSYGFANGLQFGSNAGTLFPIRTTGTLIKAYSSSTVAAGIDIASLTISGNAWASPSATISGAGAAAFASLTLSTTPLVVGSGGTGRATLTNHGVLVGAGTSPITQLSVGATGTVLAGATGADPAFTATPTVTSVNGLIITTTAATLTLANNASASLITAGNFALTLTSTNTTNATFPAGSGTLAYLAGTNSWSGVNTFSNATDATNSTTAAVILSGGLAVAKKVFTGDDFHAGKSLFFGAGGTYGAGVFYSDASWGMIIRAVTTSPALADFSLHDGADNELFRFADGAGNTLVTIGRTAAIGNGVLNLGVVTVAAATTVTWGVERRFTGFGTAGANLSLQGGGAISGGSNLAGGNLLLQPGVSTGSGASSVIIRAYQTVAAATADNTANAIATFTDTGMVVNRGVMQSAVTTVGALPSCAAGTKGARHFVTDANAAFTAGIGAVVAAGGANNVPVTCDGTSWRIGANDNIPAHLMRKFA